MDAASGFNRYTVSPSASSLKFDVATSLHPVHGEASGLRGFVDLCFEGTALARDPPPRMHVEFPVNSLRSGNTLQDREVWKVFDSRRFPLVAADLCDLEPDSRSFRYTARGDITLAGRQRRYDGEMTVRRQGERVMVEGELTFDVRDFGLMPPQLLMFRIDPQIKVRLRMIAEREG